MNGLASSWSSLDSELVQLMAKAEAAESTPLEEGLTIPGEITRPEERKAQLARARAQIEARARAKAIQEQAQPPKVQPGPKDQYHFTDPESRIRKAGSGEHFAQAYNAPAAVEVAYNLKRMHRMQWAG